MTLIDEELRSVPRTTADRRFEVRRMESVDVAKDTIAILKHAS
jgi:hypothetical protein